jgi:hypothetical protein
VASPNSLARLLEDNGRADAKSAIWRKYVTIEVSMVDVARERLICMVRFAKCFRLSDMSVDGCRRINSGVNDVVFLSQNKIVRGNQGHCIK